MAKALSDPHSGEHDSARAPRGICKALIDRLIPILMSAAAAGVGSYAVFSAFPPLYRAEAKLHIEQRAAWAASQEAVAAQIQLLTSRDFARRVAAKHKLAGLSEFEAPQAPILEAVLVATGLKRDPLRISPEERVLDVFQERLNIYPVEDSKALVIAFHSGDAAMAADIANTITAEYMALQDEARERAPLGREAFPEPAVADARMIARAAVPKEASSPPVMPLTIGAAFAGLLLSITGVMSTELASRRARRRKFDPPDMPLPLSVLGTGMDHVSVMEDARQSSLDVRAERFRNIKQSLALYDPQRIFPPARGPTPAISSTLREGARRRPSGRWMPFGPNSA